MFLKHLPIALTWFRIGGSVFFILFFSKLAQSNSALPTIIFILLALTDWLDGYLARKLSSITSFGSFLDPVADKFLVSSALLVLLWLNRIDVLLAWLIIGRELYISALRQWVAQTRNSQKVDVSSLGKWKTAGQMIAIPVLLYDEIYLGSHSSWLLGQILLWLATILSLLSMFFYTYGVLKNKSFKSQS